jgi:hypothetical protein
VFRWAIVGEWTLVGISGFATYHFGRAALFPAALTLAVALHSLLPATVLRFSAPRINLKSALHNAFNGGLLELSQTANLHFSSSCSVDRRNAMEGGL